MIDWNQVWRDRVEQNRKNNGNRMCLDKWQNPEACRNFDKKVKEDNWKRSKEIIAKLDLSPKSRVLDIGAGPGTLAIPLAQVVEHVTVAEPSGPMLQCLRENIEATGVDNITIVQKKWEDINLEKDLRAPYDVVISSYSIGGLSELADALRKMNDATSRYVYIYWFADPSPWERNSAEIWEKLHGVPYQAMGKADIIFNMLYAMGIYASLDIFPEENVNRYSGLREAVADQKNGFNIQNREQEAILRAFLMEKLRVENGQYVLRGESHRARIWWKKEQGRL